MGKSVKIFVMLLCLLGIGCERDAVKETCMAKVTSINDKITEGKLIGQFLSSPSGEFSDDVIKVGVTIKTNLGYVLVDLKLMHAEIDFYKDTNEFPVLYWYSPYGYEDIYLHGRLVYTGYRQWQR